MKFSTIKNTISIVVTLVVLFSVSAVSAQTNIILVNNDGVNEGFNDNSAPFADQTGNSGSTLGEQRLNVFQAAAEFWEARVSSPVTLRVGINFDPLLCEPGRAVLGSAGPNNVFRDFSGAPLTSTWYVEAVTNSIVGIDQDETTDDISATFNSDIDNNNNCLSGTNWWLGIDSPAVPGTISLFDTVLHEIGHGLGVLSLVALQDIPAFGVVAGQRFQDLNDAYSNHLFDEQAGEFWRDMTNAQRVASSVNTGNLTWRGLNADSNSDHLNAISRTNGHIRMFAPNPVQPGSSVSHWDTILSPDELMEPAATPTSDERSTVQLLADVGWSIIQNSGPGAVGFNPSQVSVDEDSTSATIRLSRFGGSDGAVSVRVDSSDVTAQGGVDYGVVSNQLVSWADGEMGSRSIQVSIVDDGLAEAGGETALLTLSDLSGGATLGRSTTTLRILDPSSSDNDDDILFMVVPAIAAAVRNPPAPPANPLWSVVNEVCCNLSSTTFTVTQGGVSRSSVLPSCNSVPPISSEVISTPGVKGFSFELSAPGCDALFNASGNVLLEEDTRYIFVAQFNPNSGGVDFGVASGPINQTVAVDAELEGFAPAQTIGLSKRLFSQPSAAKSSLRAVQKNR